LGVHGYRLPLAAIPLETALSELSQAMAQLAAMGAPSCITSGTLLGFVRDGKLLPHDDDIDLSLHVKGDSIPEVVANWNALMTRILDEMPAFRKEAFVAIELPCGVEVDLFPMWVLDAKVYAYPYMFGDIDEAAYFPLVAREWAGAMVHTPSVLEPVLEINYGPNWNIRDPYWKFDWPLSRERFALFLQTATRRK
jgi:hypothetical protein